MAPKHLDIKVVNDADESRLRTVLTDQGLPVLVMIETREATTAPEGTRVKASLCANVTDGHLRLPFSQSTCGPFASLNHSHEWRLEQN